MSIFSNHGNVLWLLSILTWLVLGSMLYTDGMRRSLFFRYQYPALIGYIIVSFMALVLISEHLCW